MCMYNIQYAKCKEGAEWGKNNAYYQKSSMYKSKRSKEMVSSPQTHRYVSNLCSTDMNLLLSASLMTDILEGTGDFTLNPQNNIVENQLLDVRMWLSQYVSQTF